MSKIYYAITPNTKEVNNTIRYINEHNFDEVYNYIKNITNNHDIAAAASSWCELATVGELYEHDLFTILIIDDDE